MMKLTHNDLNQIASLLGHTDQGEPPTGLCLGFTLAWSYAVLIQDEAAFYARLHFMARYKVNLAELIHSIQATRNRVSALVKSATLQPRLTQEEKQLLSIPAFFERILLHHAPENYKKLFQGLSLNQANLETISDLARPIDLEQFHIALNHYMVGSKLELIPYFQQLQDLLENSKSPYSLLINSLSHAVGLKYDLNQQIWIYCDVDDFKRESLNKNYYETCDTPSLLDHLFRSFSETNNLVFNLKVIGGLKNQEDIAQFTKFATLRPLTESKLKSYDQNHQNILLLACQDGDFETVQLLLALGANVNEPSKEKVTPLYLAAENGHHKIVALLLQESGIHLNEFSDIGATPMSMACEEGHLEVVKLLIQAGIDINKACIDTGETPLLIACQYGHLRIVKTMLQHPEIVVDEVTVNLARKNGYHKIAQNLERFMSEKKNRSSYTIIKC